MLRGERGGSCASSRPTTGCSRPSSAAHPRALIVRLAPADAGAARHPARRAPPSTVATSSRRWRRSLPPGAARLRIWGRSVTYAGARLGRRACRRDAQRQRCRHHHRSLRQPHHQHRRARCIERFRLPLVHAGNHAFPLLRTYGDTRPGEYLALVNSFGVVEIARAENSAAEGLGPEPRCPGRSPRPHRSTLKARGPKHPHGCRTRH